MARPKHPYSANASAAAELLAGARFAIPELPAFYVHRPRLLKVLAAEPLPLVLVSAPAGTGKTALVAEWTRSEPGTTAWITFEDGDTEFWKFVFECLARLGFEISVQGQETVVENGLGKARLKTVAEVIAGLPERLTIVLDGYEMLSLEVAREVDFLLQHTFGKLRLVFVGRVDPVLPLYRYRLADTVREIRVADLAFTDLEAAQLLAGSGLRLSSAAVHELNERVKGWAAGLRFAGRALAGRDSPEQSVATVVAQAGDINEYLVGEVLDAHPPQVRSFLLDTSVPDILPLALAQELTGPAAPRMLCELAKSNAFIEPVPDRPGSYRYYPFFRELLRAQLGYEAPQRMADLHRRAARWFERAGLLDHAVGHLASVAAWNEVAELIVHGRMVGRLLLEGRTGTLSKIGRALPDSLDEPAACVVRAAVALATGDHLGCKRELVRARGYARADAAGDDVVLLVAAVLDGLWGCRGADAESAADLAREAERALNERRPGAWAALWSEMYAAAQFSIGVTGLRCGELRRARAALTLAARMDAARRYPSFRADCLGYLAIVAVLEGALTRARRMAEQSVSLATAAAVAPPNQPPAAHVALACVAFEQYDLKAAREHIASAMVSSTLSSDPIAGSIAESALAGLERANGHLQVALTRLHAVADRLAATDPWLSSRLRLEAAKLSVASGQADLAIDTLAAVENHDEPEVAAIAAAAYAEQGDQATVDGYLARVRHGESPLPARVMGLLVEVVQESRRRSPGRARLALDRSLRLAASEELRRPFREAGPSVKRLLSAESRLLVQNSWLNHPGGSASPRYPDRQRLGDGNNSAAVVEELTAKEYEVLGHLQALLNTEEIAKEMSVSVNTVRTHVRSILRKLGVGRRNAAVRKARELGMVKG